MVKVQIEEVILEKIKKAFENYIFINASKKNKAINVFPKLNPQLVKPFSFLVLFCCNTFGVFAQVGQSAPAIDGVDTESNIINITTAYVDYENGIIKAKTIKDPIEKAKKENEIRRNWIVVLDVDIQKTVNMVFKETVEKKRRKLENTVAALLLLKDEKEYLMAQNDKFINSEIINTVETGAVTGLVKNFPSYSNDSIIEAEAIQGLFFTVQIGAFSRPKKIDYAFKVLPLVTKYTNGLYKYSTGIYRFVVDAVVRKNEMINKGLSRAYVTAYYNGDNISMRQANQLIKEKGDEIFAIQRM